MSTPSPPAATQRRIVKATYVGGVLRPDEPLPLPEGTPLNITVWPMPPAPQGDETPQPHPRPLADEERRGVAPPFLAGKGGERLAAIPGPTNGLHVAWILFGLAMFVYALTRLWDITRFPIYFFTDEAANPLFAESLIANGFKGAQGIRFPIYFEVASNRWGPLFSVYIHALSMSLFGKSVVVTRATQAVVSMLAPAAVALMLKQVFHMRFWWAGALLLTVAPAWFLHSRTGFETVMMGAFFACFLWFYLLYRTRAPRYLFPALLFGGLTFYTYSSGQMIMASVGAVLALSDWRYHLKHWRTTLPGLGLVMLILVPMLHFRAMNPQFMTVTLRTMGSYWFHDLTLAEKITTFVRTWLHGLSPAYWFIPSSTLLVRHRMEGYGNLSTWLLPFFLIGAGWCLWHIKAPAPRAVLLTALVTPMGAALMQDVGITRVLAFTIPASLLIALGLHASLEFLGRLIKIRYDLATAVLFIGLTAAGGGMLRDALVNGPLWFRDYGLYGMQYGALQLFGEAIPEYLRAHPESRIAVSPNWANGTDNFVRFFLTREQQARVQMLNVDYFMAARRPLDSNTLLVMTPEEYAQARNSPKFKSVEVERILPYPDGRPGFYFVRLTYADRLDEILAEEREARSQPVVERIVLNGETVEVLHSQFDMGRLADVFDGDPFTLARGLEANPLVFELRFPTPRRVAGLKATFGAMDFALKVLLRADEQADPVIYEQTFRNLPSDPKVELVFDRGPTAVRTARIEILQLNAGGDVHIHVRELALP
ncbi:MAG: glycosyltransferase family 39 protein [Anaerolineae bacterium]|nr:glycosyltransferase family 39 protein [Anaerolineae bacterium]